MPGLLYVVATPIGNLGDMVPRAVKVLQEVDIIAAEDTRHSMHLLRHFDIATPLLAFHDYSSEQALLNIMGRLMRGENVALISDAGTPLISDPGYRLVARAREEGVEVLAVPGACALIAALSVAGLPTDRFIFEGFLPAKAMARRARLEALVQEVRTLVFYEAPHRIVEMLTDVVDVFGPERQVVMARELTKRFETVLSFSAGALLERVARDADQQRGEIVVMVSGCERDVAMLDDEVCRVAGLLAAELPPKKAAAMTAAITGGDKRQIYDWLVKQD